MLTRLLISACSWTSVLTHSRAQLLFLWKSSIIWASLIPIKTHLQLRRLVPSPCGINHLSYTHTLTSFGEGCDSMSVYEGGCSEWTRASQTPVWSDSLCVVLLRSGRYWDVFWEGGSGSSDPPASAPLSLTWMTSKRALSSEQTAQECA